MEKVIRTGGDLSPELLHGIATDVAYIKRSLASLNVIKHEDHYSPKKYCEIIGVSRWQFEMLKAQGKIDLKKIGRKIYVPANQVQKYFDGLITLDK